MNWQQAGNWFNRPISCLFYVLAQFRFMFWRVFFLRFGSFSFCELARFDSAKWLVMSPLLKLKILGISLL